MQVIILDDSPTIRQIISLHLDDLELNEEEIVLFEDGNKALEYIKENGADIVFSDINMPIMEGTEFAKKLFEFRPDLQKNFFVVSGDENGNATKKMREVGAKRFLKKPINEQQFKHFIKKEIEQIRLRAKYDYRAIKQQEEMIDEFVILTRTDTKGSINYVSKAFAKISGYSKKELIGKPHNIVRHPDMPKSVFADLWKTIKSGKTWQGEIKNLRKDGTFYWVKANVSPIKDYNNRVIGYASVRLDITDSKRLQELSSSK